MTDHYEIVTNRDVVRRLRELDRLDHPSSPCPVPRHLLGAANGDAAPDAVAALGHSIGCPICRLALASLRAALADDPDLEATQDDSDALGAPREGRA